MACYLMSYKVITSTKWYLVVEQAQGYLIHGNLFRCSLTERNLQWGLYLPPPLCTPLYQGSKSETSYEVPGKINENCFLIFHLIKQESLTMEKVEKILEALKIYKETGDKEAEGKSYIALGSLYHDLGQYEKSIEYFEESLSCFSEIGNKAGELSACSKLGGAFDSLGRYKKSIEYFELALSLSKEVEDKEQEGEAYSNLGGAFAIFPFVNKRCHFRNT